MNETPVDPLAVRKALEFAISELDRLCRNQHDLATENERLRSALQFVVAFNAESVPVPNGVLAVVEAALAEEGS